MKITPTDTKLAQLNALSAAPDRVHERKTAAHGGAPGLSQPSANVQISPEAKLAAQSLDASFNAEKVERISQAIRDGSFKVNAEAVADKLIANAREQLAKTYR